MDKVCFSLLRGVCQIPAYVAYERDLFAKEGLDVHLRIEPTAWMVPRKLIAHESHFAVIPWTRAVMAGTTGAPFVLISGSGFEEAALVVRRGLDVGNVERVAVPLRGGMKDLTAMGLIESLGWKDIQLVRCPSGDGAIIALFGEGVDAASMVEPYATMMEALGVGTVLRRTGDVWPGAPGCSLTTTVQLKEENPSLVRRVVRAFRCGIRFVESNPDESAEIASRYIGVHPKFVRRALQVNRPRADAIRNQAAMADILRLMMELGYIEKVPDGYLDLSFLDHLDTDGQT
jgi:ABC-type nitrate/sulfonate/bicarbonate transport system substrate-binding protein